EEEKGWVFNPDGSVQQGQVNFTDYRSGPDLLGYHNPDGLGGDLCEAPVPAALNAMRLAAERNVLHLWIRLLHLYQGTQPAPPPSPVNKTEKQRTYPTDAQLAVLDGIIDNAPDEQTLKEKVVNHLPMKIELRMAPIDQSWSEYQNPAPLLRTHSAFGVLKTI